MLDESNEREDTAQLFSLSSQKTSKPDKFSYQDRTLTREQLDATAGCMKHRATIGQRSSIQSTRRRADQLAIEADRLTKCGRNWRLEQCADCRTEYHAPISCNSRVCPRCSRRYARQWEKPLAAALAPLFVQKKRGKALMLVTLTVTSNRFGSELPDREGFNRFHRESHEFVKEHYGKWYTKRSKAGRLVEDATRYYWTRDSLARRVKQRRTPIPKTTKTGKTVMEWRRWRGSGAVMASELGGHGDRTGYLNNNLHAHALVYGDYYPLQTLIQSWQKITGDSRGVHVTQVRTLKAAVNYVLKYITKPPAIGSADGLAEWAEMIKGVRRLRTSGIFVNAIRREKVDSLPHKCPKCGGFLCDCGEHVIEDIEAHHTLNLYKLLREAQQLPPPAQADRPGNATDHLIDQKESAFRAEIRLNWLKLQAQWVIGAAKIRRENALPTFQRIGFLSGMVYPPGCE